MPVTAAASAFNSSPLQHVGSSAVASVRRAGARVIFRALSLHCARCGEGRLTLRDDRLGWNARNDEIDENACARSAKRTRMHLGIVRQLTRSAKKAAWFWPTMSAELLDPKLQSNRSCLHVLWEVLLPYLLKLLNTLHAATQE